MSKNDKKRRIILEIMGGFILLAIIIFSVFFLNRKHEVSFYLDNGSDVQVVYVKHNKIINSSNIKGKEDLGESFVDWYEIVDVKDGKDILAEKPFDFKTKINPSDPIPKCLSLTFLASSSLFSIFWFIASM